MKRSMTCARIIAVHRRLKLQDLLILFKDAVVRSHRKTCRLFLTMTYAKLQNSCF